MKYLYTGILVLILTAMGAANAETTDLGTIKRLAAEGKGEIAIEKLNERIMANQQDVQARFLKAVLSLERGDTNTARALFMEISQQFPQLPEPYNNLAALYARDGDYEKARQALLDAVTGAPDYPVVRANLGDLYVNLAVDAYRRAVELNPQDQASQAKLRLLEKMFAASN